MFGFNGIDVILIALLILAFAGGIKLGFLNQLLVVGGFFGALFLFGALFPHLLPISDRTIRTIINANLVLVASLYVAIRGYDLAQHVHWSFHISPHKARKSLQRIDAWFGVLPSIGGSLLLIWLLAAMIGRLPFEGFSNSTSDARIVQTLNRALPPVPAVLDVFNRQVNANAQPYLFVQPKPQSSFAYSEADVQAAAARAAASVVRITSFGCEGNVTITGSGFVAAPNLVVTNAHVIAGVKRPIVKYNNRSYEGVPILFNSNLDFAILRVQNLNAQPLLFAKDDVAVDTSVAALGYPGGNFRVSAGLIRNNFVVFGRNIYDVGLIGRAVYEVQVDVDHGSSGGPIVLKDGRVAGVIFSKSTDESNYAYALSSSHLIDELTKAEQSYQHVSNGTCLAK